MLQTKCVHSKALPVETCSFCYSTAPEPLVDISFQYILNNIGTICSYENTSDNWNLRPGVTLPVELCERFLNAPRNGGPSNDFRYVTIFKDRHATRLKRVKLRNTEVNDKELLLLLEHGLLELEISYNLHLTTYSLSNIIENSGSLHSLILSDCPNLLPEDEVNCHDYNPCAPNLRKVALRNFSTIPPGFYITFFSSLFNLTHVDLSNCGDLSDLSFLKHLSMTLTALILYNVDIEPMVESICKLKRLRYLDISQSKEERGKYTDGSRLLAAIVESLPGLVSLDISGTNLAGRGVAAEIRMGESAIPYASDISGLSSRVNNPFQFLGLYETQHDACLRHDIPARLIAGNANEEQILIAAHAYLERPHMLQKVLNELFHLFRYENCEYVGQALNVVLEAMNKHITERHIQISGSATLFYIVKGTGKELHEAFTLKRRIITTLLNGMSTHKNDDTMMRNGCLTLCQFKIPADVLFEYERLVRILLHSVYDIHQESFVQRIGIYLLNSLACQVDGAQKVRLGELGAITKMIWLISERLARGVCDDVLEVAWSMMWNVTDETPPNCKKFLENKGMEFFLKCLEKFSEKEELLRNMMGLLGNVAEVRDLRHYLMTSEYISVFSDLLDSVCDGIEVSYNAAGVISHIASDGPEVWTVREPSREQVLNRMMAAIDRWDINSHRNINYRSFEPILYLVKMYDTPECQRWAVWALANLTSVYPEKYCSLVESEGGLDLLLKLMDDTRPPLRVKELACIVINNCRQYSYREPEYIDVDSQLDG